MHDLPLTLLRSLAAVYETGGVRPAGRLLGVQHSAVSRALKALEAWIEAPLIEPREGRAGLVFTPEGEALAKAALAALTQLDAAVLSARERHRAHSVAIATTPSFAARWLLPRLPELEQLHPHIEVSIIVDQARKSPQSSGADLHIRMGMEPPAALHPYALMADEVFPVMNRALWDRLDRPEDVNALIGQTLVHDRDPSMSWARWRDAHGPARLDVRSGPRLTSSDLVLRAAEQGQGVALARARLAADSLQNGTLVRPFGSLALDLGPNYWLLTNPEAQRRSAVRRVAEWCKAAAGISSGAPDPVDPD